MSQVELLTRAIEKLETLKKASTPGEWQQRPYEGAGSYPKSRLVRVVEEENEWGYDRVESLADYLTLENAKLIGVLHRTIDAQLNILRDAISFYSDPIPAFIGYEAQVVAYQVALAEAILGDDV